MSLFSGSKVISNTIFDDTKKIVNITNIVTQIVTHKVTERIEGSNLLFKNLYDDVGINIKNILTAFVTGSDDLKTLIDYENYSSLADKLHSHLNEDNKDLEQFRSLLISAIEGVKHSDNRMLEQENAYKKLLDAFNALVNQESKPTILEASTVSSLIVEIKPEIIEYIRRGYKIIDDDGKLIPIDMNVLAQIRKDINIITIY